MNYKQLIITLTLFFGVTAFSQTNGLISVTDFKVLQNSETSYSLIDLRKSTKFEEGHIEGAINLWRTQIVDSTLEFGGFRISRDTLQALLSKHGVKSNDRIIIYDEKGDVDAARLWWMLSIYGHKNVALLNGGLTEWGLKNQSVTTDALPFKASIYEYPNKADYSMMISLEEVKKAEKDANTFILDTRCSDEFVGIIQKKGAYAKGRIPNSVLIDWACAINYNTDRKFKSLDELKSIYNLDGIAKNHPIITYCQSGVRSAHTTFVLTQLLEFTNVKNYDGSWIEWSYHSELPIETGEIIAKQKSVEKGCSKNNNSDCQTKFYMIIGGILLVLLIVNLYFRRKNKV